jgi:hypothetical protein
MIEHGISYPEPPPHALLQLFRTAIDEDEFVVSAEPIVARFGAAVPVPTGGLAKLAAPHRAGREL